MQLNHIKFIIINKINIKNIYLIKLNSQKKDQLLTIKFNNIEYSNKLR